MSYWMLATFADSFRSAPAREEMARARAQAGAAPAPSGHGVDLGAAEPEELEHVLADTVLADFKKRLGRIGIEYQTPVRP
jgi:hypothetical protein